MQFKFPNVIFYFLPNNGIVNRIHFSSLYNISIIIYEGIVASVWREVQQLAFIGEVWPKVLSCAGIYESWPSIVRSCHPIEWQQMTLAKYHFADPLYRQEAIKEGLVSCSYQYQQLLYQT